MLCVPPAGRVACYDIRTIICCIVYQITLIVNSEFIADITYWSQCLLSRKAGVMVVEKVDRRIQRTQELLSTALLELILERGYEAVTIKDVTERANVAYVTFFRHYRDLDELLVQRLTAGIAELMEHI